MALRPRLAAGDHGLPAAFSDDGHGGGLGKREPRDWSDGQQRFAALRSRALLKIVPVARWSILVAPLLATLGCSLLAPSDAELTSGNARDGGASDASVPSDGSSASDGRSDGASACSGCAACNAGACASCGLQGERCSTQADCCSGDCTRGRCGLSQCVGPGDTCMAEPDCCTGTCLGNTCGACRTNGQACASNDECCSLNCSNSRCDDCLGVGAPCGGQSQRCCGGNCAGGVGNSRCR